MNIGSVSSIPVAQTQSAAAVKTEKEALDSQEAVVNTLLEPVAEQAPAAPGLGGLLNVTA